jgi:hypothetical protein
VNLDGEQKFIISLLVIILLGVGMVMLFNKVLTDDSIECLRVGGLWDPAAGGLCRRACP